MPSSTFTASRSLVNMPRSTAYRLNQSVNPIEAKRIKRRRARRKVQSHKKDVEHDHVKITRKVSEFEDGPWNSDVC